MSPIDLSDVKGPGPIDEGEYLLKIVKAEVGESKAGAEKVDLQYEIMDGEYAGRKIFDTISFHPNALSFAKGTLDQLGIDTSKKFELFDLAENLLGLEVSAVVKIQESTQIDPRTGEAYPERNRISRILQVL